jgi:hypothetical protein
MRGQISKSTFKSHEKRNSKFQKLLENENLVCQEIPEEQDSLFKALSDGLYFTPDYYQQIKDLCIRYLTDLITTNKIPPKLGIFRGNSMLWNDYLKNPSSPNFFRINIELFSLAFNVRVVVYTVTDDGILTAKIYNNKFDKIVQFINPHGVHLDIIYTKKFMQIIGFCQNIAMNIINRALDGKHSTQEFEWKDFNNDKYSRTMPVTSSRASHELMNEESKKEPIIQDEKESEEHLRMHKRAKSDSELIEMTKSPQDQLEFYNMFVGLKSLEELSKLVEQDLSKLSQSESLFSSLSLVHDSRYSIGEKTTTGEDQINLGLTYGKTVPNQRRVIFAEEDEEELPSTDMMKLEKSRSYVDPKSLQKSPIHFINTIPPGLTPNRYSTKTYASDDFTQALIISGENEPKNRYSESHGHVLISDPSHQQQNASHPTISTKIRTAGRTLSLSTQSEEFNKLQGTIGSLIQGMETNSQAVGVPSQRTSVPEKKKPIVIDESQHRYTGRLKFFDEGKNYGFIVMDDDGSDIFVHYDDLHKANINKEFLKSTRFGNAIRLSFNCMEYIGKYNRSRKATEIQFLT